MIKYYNKTWCVEVKNNYFVENELIHFRRANKDDNMEEIAKLI